MGRTVVLACAGAVLLGLLSTALLRLVVQVPLLLRQVLHADVAAGAFPVLLGGTGLVLLRGLLTTQARVAVRHARGAGAGIARGAAGTPPRHERVRALVRRLAVGVGALIVVVLIAAAEALVVGLLVT